MDIAAEIRARLDQLDEELTSALTYGPVEVPMAAVEAVLKLHEPVPLGTYLGDVPPLECLECVEAAGVSAAWPCATVKAIAKALGVDAAH